MCWRLRTIHRITLIFNDRITLIALIFNDRITLITFRCSLPPYIIMHVKRFVRDTQNRCEKNPTIVNFPIKNLDMSNFCTPEAAAAVPSTRYDLVANVCHEGSWDHGMNLRQHAVLYLGFGVDMFRLCPDFVAV
jgi:hypothetical protein